MKEWLRMLGLMSMVAGLPACRHDDPYFFLKPQIPVTVPFAMDKAGNKAGIDFWAVPGSVDLDKTYMVSLTFDRKGVHDPMPDFSGKPPRTLLPVRATVFHVVNDRKEPIPAFDYDEFLHAADSAKFPLPAWGKPGTDEKNVSLNSWTGDQAFMWIASFHLKAYGHYRVEVETAQDQPLFKGIKSELVVQERFKLGE